MMASNNAAGSSRVFENLALKEVSNREAMKSSASKKNGRKFLKMSLSDFQTGGPTQGRQALKSSCVATAADLELVQSIAKTAIERPHPTEINPRYNSQNPINAKFFGLQYVHINDVRDRLLFSQKNVSDMTSTGLIDYPISELADSMFIKFDKNFALDIVENNDGSFTSIDNRRLLVAKKLGALDSNYGIWVKVHAANAKLEPQHQRRFRAATWGGAVAERMDGAKLSGFTSSPRILGRVEQTIPLNIDREQYNYDALDPTDREQIFSQVKLNTIKI